MVKSRILAISLLAVLVLLIGMGAVACDGNGDENGAPPGGVEMEITSTAFQDGGTIPTEHTCDGQDISPALSWSGAPEGTQSFTLIVDDPDSPSGDFTHWIIFNISADTSTLVASISTAALSVILWQGENDFGSIGYRGPCPPSGQTHHYRFTVYALDVTLELDAGATRAQVLNAMQGHLLAQGELIAIYQR
ncbi:hypothetical protein ES703_26793 [subsurface metagenome]